MPNNLQEEIAGLKKALADKDWASRKTNQGIRILYKELEQKNEELKELDRLKSDFVSTASHELRTPLSITKEGIAIVLSGVTGRINKRQKELLKTSEESLERLKRIINDLLDISKIELGKLELSMSLVDLSLMVNQVCSQWKPELDKKEQTLNTSIAESPVNIYLDIDKIIQVLHNFISNAVKFTPQRGTITVELKDREGSVEVSVSDTGKGIAKDDLPKLFSKFQQFGRLEVPGEKGSGLGLAISKGIIQMHQGTINVESQINKGSKFTFTLPRRDSELMLEECINGRIKDALGMERVLSLFLIYIPVFNEIRRDMGYEKSNSFFGDIEKVAKNSLRRREDSVLRGPGELAILLFDVDKKGVTVIRKRIEKAIKAYLSRSAEKSLRKVRCTYGYALCPEETSNGRELLRQARAMARS